MTEEEKNEQYLRDREMRVKIKNAYLFTVASLLLVLMELLVIFAFNSSRAKMLAEGLSGSPLYPSSVEGYYFMLIFAVIQTELLLAFVIMLTVRIVRGDKKRKGRALPVPTWVWAAVFAAAAVTDALLIRSCVGASAALSAARETGAELPEHIALFGKGILKCIFGTEAAAAALSVWIGQIKRKKEEN